MAAFGKAQCKCLAELANTSQFASLSIFEPGVSGSYRSYLSKLPNYSNSFYWKNGTPGLEQNGVRHEDLMSLSFEDACIDLVISSDVFEHIRHPWVAFQEIKRVLKPGGLHIFSVPVLIPMASCTKYRVDTSTDVDIYIEEPRYHGDGRGGKSLVYTDFGGDFIDGLERIGFRTFCISNDHTDEERTRAVAFITEKVLA